MREPERLAIRPSEDSEENGRSGTPSQPRLMSETDEIELGQS
jgi:hypothetical protein